VVTAAALRAFDGPPPRFLLHGLHLTSSHPECRVYAYGAREAGGPDPALEPETAVCEPPGAFASGVGAQLTRDLRALFRDRGIVGPCFNALPHAEPTSTPVLVRGVATRVEIDIEHTMLMPNALHWDELPPLRLRHGSEPVGEILALEYSSLGDELRIECRVDDVEAARMPSFSVCFTPEAYELVDRGGRNFHFRVIRARLDEISLTENPALRSALVERRCPASPPLEDVRYRAVMNQMARLRLAIAA
jgi:hypothetical protein